MTWVIDLDDVDATMVDEVGGKGAQLGELRRLDGVSVPAGFCVTTEALDRTSGELPDGLLAVLDNALARFDAKVTFAVRSSAVAEDQPGASFAGQLESFLDVSALDVAERVGRCRASAFSERATAYLARSGADMRMAVVVQQMVHPDAAGVLFTADPVTSNRAVAVIEAVAGLADGLLTGRAQADSFGVRDDVVVSRTVTGQPTLTDEQAVRLARLGLLIEAHTGRPQDIEWCRVGEAFHIVQSRPITTLFPIPESADGQHHVYVSVGHQQMMTDPMTSLGLSVWQMSTPRPMAEAGGRLFVDVAPLLATPTGRDAVLRGLGGSDPLIGDALQTVLDRDFVPLREDDPTTELPAGLAQHEPIETDPGIVPELIEQSRASVAAAQRGLAGLRGIAVFDAIAADLHETRGRLTDPRSLQVIMAGFEAARVLNDKLADWLGERNAADRLTQSVPHNVTSEMGLALLDLADEIRPYPDVVALLRRVAEDPAESFIDQLSGRPAAAVTAFLDTYGMRCPGEIDITRPRWSERPAMLVPSILTNVATFEAGESARRYQRGRADAAAWARELLERVGALPDGERKAADIAALIERVRTFAGFREYPKYAMVSRYLLYKRTLLAEADRLVDAGVLHDREDCFHLRFDELREAVRTQSVDPQLVEERRRAMRFYATLTPPRVLTSDGETLSGQYRRDDVPAGALPGLPVSAGVVEGRARVVLDMARADLAAGDILVTTYTDPSWTPLFVTAAALVTEVGGALTHGAVIAREYGLPAVVGVDGATSAIRDGQRIRVHGSAGYVELLLDQPR